LRAGGRATTMSDRVLELPAASQGPLPPAKSRDACDGASALWTQLSVPRQNRRRQGGSVLRPSSPPTHLHLALPPAGSTVTTSGVAVTPVAAAAAAAGRGGWRDALMRTDA